MRRVSARKAMEVVLIRITLQWRWVSEQLKVKNAYSDVLNGCVLRGVVSVCGIVCFVRVL
jgi:hypothetical protein